MELNKIYKGNAIKVLSKLPKRSIHMCVTSPPYWGLRSYLPKNVRLKKNAPNWVKEELKKRGIKIINIYKKSSIPKDLQKYFDPVEFDIPIWDDDKNCQHRWGNTLKNVGNKPNHGHSSNIMKVMESTKDAETKEWTSGVFCQKCGAWKGELGLEPSPELYVKHLCDILDGVKNVLRDDGTLWLNIGDSFVSAKSRFSSVPHSISNNKNRGEPVDNNRPDLLHHKYLKDKDLAGIPWRVAFELQRRGWYLRSDIIWNKPAPMPESVKDRPTKSHEYIFMLAKSKHYYYDKEAIKEKTVNFEKTGEKRNNYDVWNINTCKFPDAHFAVFPRELIRPCIKAGCPLYACAECGNPKLHIIEKETVKNRQNDRKDANVRIDGLERPPSDWKPRKIIKDYWKSSCSCGEKYFGGIVLDPFMGSGTTAIEALSQNKQYIGIEPNQEYINIAEKRIDEFVHDQESEKENNLEDFF